MGRTTRAAIRVGGLKGREGLKEIEHNLIQIDGVKEVQISLPESTVNIEYDPGVIREEYLKRTLNSLGYSPYVD
ncbi:MAG: heavy-metal-associated domain-containing protein [Peptococcaceae bacterium]|nr:heavy-metal-associated domain-containing protein [Peptococcaceae bacterium]